MDYRGNATVKMQQTKRNTMSGVAKSGVVEGKFVQKILLDTGCSRTLIRKDLVPPKKILQGEVVAI